MKKSKVLELLKNGNPSRLSKSIRGPRGMPFLGNTMDFLRDHNQYVLSNAQKFGGMFRQNIFFSDSLYLLGVDAYRFVVEDPEKIFSAALGMEPFLGEMFPNSIVMQDFEEHAHNRKILQKGFSSSAISSYVEKIKPIVNLFSSDIDFKTNSSGSFDTLVKELNLSIALKILFDADPGKNISKIARAYTDINRACTSIIRNPVYGMAMRRGVRAREFLCDYICEIVRDRKINPCDDMVSMLVSGNKHDGSGMNEQVITDHMLAILSAANDTTTSLMCSTIWLLAKNPNWQEKLFDEYSKYDSLDLAVLSKFEKTEWVYKESARLYAPVPSITRRNIYSFKWDGIFIPANTWVLTSAHYNHMSDSFWTKPKEFDPERFSLSRSENKADRYAWSPFGGGPHSCAGIHLADAQIKIFLYFLVKKYRVKVNSDRDLERLYIPVCLPKNGFPVEFIKR